MSRLDEAAALRHFIYAHFFREGHPPDLASMRARFGDGVRTLLGELADAHAIVLSALGDSVDVAHPFSRLPTPFWVENRHGGWWGNCAWDSLAIAALTPDDRTTITTRSGASGAPIRLEVHGDEVSDPSLVAHFAYPAARWWDDVRQTCATILFFAGEGEIDPWCARHGIPRGEVVPVGTLWRLSRPWYADRLDAGWRRRTVPEAQAILDEVGLTGPFWDLSAGWR